MKKVVVFDLDGTLAPSKSPLPDEMSDALGRLLEKYEVCVISGGKFGQFETQLIGNLKVREHLLARLHIMPTCGTRYYRYEDISNTWKQLYAEDFTEPEKNKIIAALKEGVSYCGYDKEKTWGEQIEDRGSQITFSALGQEAPVAAKEAWDPTKVKKAKLRDFVAAKIPEFEVRSGGSTSIDITKLGIDKAYGMHKLMAELEIGKYEIIFIGDRLDEDGNDYPVKAMGVDCVAVNNWRQTLIAIETLLSVIG